jgi:hypothetical protein
MQWSVVTITLFAGVAILFVAGVGLVWVGLRREPDRLPDGADDVLDAIVTGRLAPPPGPKSVDHTGEIRLVPRAEPVPAEPAPLAKRVPADNGGAVKIITDPRDKLSEASDDDDLTLTEKLFFADEPHLQKF